MRYKPGTLIDIDESKVGTSIGGVKVFGNRNSIMGRGQLYIIIII